MYRMQTNDNQERKIAMITVRIDKAKFTEELKSKFVNVIDPTSTIYRQLALELIPRIQDRIHVKGQAADGKEIGTYSSAYLKIRSGSRRGEKKSSGKSSGKSYNRSADPKVILSLTRQMENDYAVIGTSRGWGIGFNNPFNANKAKWNNKRYGGRVIYDLTDSEVSFAVEFVNYLINKEFE